MNGMFNKFCDKKNSPATGAASDLFYKTMSVFFRRYKLPVVKALNSFGIAKYCHLSICLFHSYENSPSSISFQLHEFLRQLNPTAIDLRKLE